MYPAAFRRLCVETFCAFGAGLDFDPAAFRRLCVETSSSNAWQTAPNPAAFRRLCVETPDSRQPRCPSHSSRLQAAVC